ncbi:MAG: radical SAM/SPASM domain-containing protein [Thermodesulfobacteriota bacterium]
MQLSELCLEITDRCIMNCVHCSTAAKLPGKVWHELSLEEIKSIIIDFKGLGGSILEISGGEPTLHQELVNIVEFSKNLDLEVRLYTCGVSYQIGYGPLNEALLKKLHDLGLDKIIFNLQGPESNIHDRITRKPGSFMALRESVTLAKMLGFWVGAHFVPMKLNAGAFPNVIKLAIDLNIDEVAILRFVPQGRGEINEEALRLTKVELWDFLRNVAEIRQKLENKIHLRTGCPLDFLSFIDKTVTICGCKAGKSTCSITPLGETIPCPGFKHVTEFVAGNVKNQPLSLIWRESEVFNLLRRVDFHDISGCSECARIEICKGRCAAQRVRYHRNILMGPDPDCLGPYPREGKLGVPFVCPPSKIDIISELSIG